MTTDPKDIREAVRELVKDNAALTEKVAVLTQIVKNHEHDKRDGGIKFDVGYL